VIAGLGRDAAHGAAGIGRLNPPSDHLHGRKRNVSTTDLPDAHSLANRARNFSAAMKDRLADDPSGICALDISGVS
jgi:hypothetical protein